MLKVGDRVTARWKGAGNGIIVGLFFVSRDTMPKDEYGRLVEPYGIPIQGSTDMPHPNLNKRYGPWIRVYIKQDNGITRVTTEDSFYLDYEREENG